MADKSKTAHIDNPKWLEGVRDDLDTAAEDWALQTKPEGVSKLNAIGSYLDTILNELGVCGRLHDCPECGTRHLGPKP